MKVTSNADWFKKLAGAVRIIVDDLGGAMVMTRERLNHAVVEVDPSLVGCPPYVLSHLTCALKPRQGLHSRAIGVIEQVLIIFDPKVVPDADSALSRCQQNGLPEDVEICLIEAGLREVVPA